VKSYLTINIHINNMKNRRVKQALSGMGSSGRGRLNGEGEGGKIWWL
jgi:hypothetical protein